MARAPDRSSASQFSTSGYINSWAANNPYYAANAANSYEFNLGNQHSNAAIRSGVVQTAGYNNVSPRGYGPSDGYGGTLTGVNSWQSQNRANPRNSSSAPYDQLGNVKKQGGDINLGLVLMGGYQFPGQAMSPVRDKNGNWGDNALVKFLKAQGSGGVTNPNLRRRWGYDMGRSRGWVGNLTYSAGPNKAFANGSGGRGQSSEDSTQEMYSTLETRLGTRAQFTDEAWQEKGAKFGRSWAGYKPMGQTSGNPHLNAQLGQMYNENNPNVGGARRVQRTYL